MVYDLDKSDMIYLVKKTYKFNLKCLLDNSISNLHCPICNFFDCNCTVCFVNFDDICNCFNYFNDFDKLELDDNYRKQRKSYLNYIRKIRLTLIAEFLFREVK